MSDFVEQCRVEWRRLGVPDGLAEEMAAELASDLREAEGDGISPEELLGASPRAFAATWAAERGVVPATPGSRRRRRPRVLLGFTGLAALVLVATAWMLATGEPKLSLVQTKHKTGPGFPGVDGVVTAHRVVAQASAAAPIEWILLVLAAAALAFAAWLWAGWSGSQRPDALA